jgi:serine/threonine protein kinase
LLESRCDDRGSEFPACRNPIADGHAVAKVIDFGVAKATGQNLSDRTVFTSFQAVIGTPLYMNPEQAALSNVDVTTKSLLQSHEFAKPGRLQ